MSRSWLLSSFVSICTAIPVAAQVGGDAAAELAAEQAEAEQAIRQWAEEYAAGRLEPKAGLASSPRLQPGYMQHARRAGVLRDDDLSWLTHLDMLQKLLTFAERHPNARLADAVLGVAAAGLDGAFLDRVAAEVRDLGHCSLMRVEHRGAWFLLLRTAAGQRVGAGGAMDATGESAGPIEPARRIAALRLLGERALPVFRSTVEAALVDEEPRVRLAAAEAIRPPWTVTTVRNVAAALAAERHPIASQAQVRLLFAMLRRPPAGLGAGLRRELVARAVARLGQLGWRTDMDLLDLIEAFPHRSAIPHLIDTLDQELRAPDALVAAVNEHASPRLRQRVGGLLRAMTGALVPPEDAAAWRAFWAQEQQHVVVPEQLAVPGPGATRATFFGVAVTGRSVAFMADTSGSMGVGPDGEVLTKAPRRIRRANSRLGQAKRQLALAVQSMPYESQFFVLTFADEARLWTPYPVKPNRPTARSLTGLTSQLDASGSTNLYAGLVAALAVENRSYGQDAAPRIDELFVISDGEPTAGEIVDAEALLGLVRAANKYAKVRINTVFSGTGDGAALMRRLAEENGGVFVQR